MHTCVHTFTYTFVYIHMVVLSRSGSLKNSFSLAEVQRSGTSISLVLITTYQQKYRAAVQKGRSKAQQLPAGARRASRAIWSMGRKCGAFTGMSLRPFAQSAPPETQGARSPLPRKPEQNLNFFFRIKIQEKKCPWRRTTPVWLCGGRVSEESRGTVVLVDDFFSK